MMRVWPGQPSPLGATWDGKGVNFALFSAHATRVELCLFDSVDAQHESACVPLFEQTDQVWHGYLPDIKPGQLYGYRVHGSYAPHEGHRFNPNKVLLDPYAKMLGRDIHWSDRMFGFIVGDSQADASCDERDNADRAPLGVVIDDRFRWGSDAPPKVPWHKTLIYELHVKGFTQQHPDIPKHLRGTYAGLASPPAIHHFKKLGVTALELLPLQHFVNDRHLIEQGLSNYWGYNTLSFFAPYLHYASNKDPYHALREFKQMVKTLHKAGLEVILDVVYNHTGEGNQFGPTVSFRGIDNASYYRLSANRRYYQDYTGCGNTLNTLCPRVLQLIMDSLRYWIQEMHIDGFRFDLCTALGRELHAFDKMGAFFDIIHQDPVISQVKLIAEPWDLGEGGYQVGNFPVLWSEWNGKYRDTIRRFWKGDHHVLSEMGTRLLGSSDLYEHSERRPYASINFVTSHDGFTLHDLVTYHEKRNLANGENGRDGDNHNLSWNCGVEGETKDPKIRSLREKQKRNFLATLMISQGVPMLRSGDEIGQTQQGNNNVYCQDNELSWLNWKLSEEQEKHLEFVTQAIRIWKDHPVLQRRHFFQGKEINREGLRDVIWFNSKGVEMTNADWNNGSSIPLGYRLEGHMVNEFDEYGKPIHAHSLLILINALAEDVSFAIPEHQPKELWKFLLDTSLEVPERKWYEQTEHYFLRSRSLAVLELIPFRSTHLKRLAHHFSS